MIPIARPVITEREKEKVLEVMDSGMLTAGEYVSEFERQFAGMIGCKYGTGTSSGTTALEVAVKAAGIGEGDRVLTTPFSFIASSNALLYAGAKPVFADVDRDTFNIDPASIRKKLEEEPDINALLIVHLYGLPCNMEEIMEIVEEYDLILIEDCAQAHGAQYEGQNVGTFGDAAIYSFYPTKNMTTGEGGIVVTDNKDIRDKARLLIDHGQTERYCHRELGYNYRMTNIAAAIGLAQLERLSEFNNKRRENATLLSEKLHDLSFLQTPVIPEEAVHVFHQYTVRVEEREKLIPHLEAGGVDYGIHYPVPVYRQPLYRERGYDGVSLPTCERLCEEVISLPVHPSLSRTELETIIATVRDFAH